MQLLAILIQIVTLTTYMPTVRECDSNPNITASGYRIGSSNKKIIAVSRDLKKTLKWGDRVLVSNAGIFNGIYYVHDLMNKRHTKRIDVLIYNKKLSTKMNNVYVSKL